MGRYLEDSAIMDVRQGFTNIGSLIILAGGLWIGMFGTWQVGFLMILCGIQFQIFAMRFHPEKVQIYVAGRLFA